MRATPDYRAWRVLLMGAECKVMRLQEGPTSEERTAGDNPETVVNYLRAQIPNSIAYRPEVENLMCVYLTTRRKPITWQVISNGSIDTVLVHPREIFKAAILLNAAAIVIAHNHPSGEPSPSEADVKITRDMIRAGQLLKIDLLDHLILGTATPDRPKSYASLRELGYFYT